jgi:hypothetical protein
MWRGRFKLSSFGRLVEREDACLARRKRGFNSLIVHQFQKENNMIHEGGSFQSFRDPNGNLVAAINRDGSVLAQEVLFGDGTSQSTAGGGSSAVQVATVTLTAAQLIAGTRITVIPGVVNSIVLPLSISVYYKYGTAIYNSVATPVLDLTWDSSAPYYNHAFISVQMFPFLQNAVNSVPALTSMANYPVSGPATNFVGGSFYAVIDPASPLTDGDGTITVTIPYVVIPV